MKKIIFQVDAFTSEPFKGNPAGVYITDNILPDKLMQNIAMEMNLSETAFVTPQDKGFRIRFYTPASEIELCGHATLSASHILYETGKADPDEKIDFHSKAGILNTRTEKGKIVMNLPVYGLKRIGIPPGLSKNTGLEPLELYQSDYNWKLLLMKTDEEVKNASPESSALIKAGLGQLIITAVSSDRKYDFVVRCFVPGLGIAEDPVTGSAHCALTPFWSMKSGKKEFRSFQASKRTGELFVRLSGDRVEVAGEAVTIMKSEFFI